MSHACPSCGSGRIDTIYEVRGIPAHSVLLMPSRAEARDYPKRDLRLGACRGCGFVFNAIFDEGVHEYSTRYEETQGFSPTFNTFAKALAKRLVEKFDLHGKDIVEIGCGKGEFLALLCELGKNRGVGIDPAYVPERRPGPEWLEMRFLQEFYAPKHAEIRADFICCRHTLEHIARTRELMELIRATIGERRDVVVSFELPDVLRVLEEGAFWDIYYEHCSYFSTGSLARLFRATGFDVVDLELDFNDQYIILNARPVAGATKASLPLEMDEARLFAAIDAFPKVVGAAMEKWKGVVFGAHAAGKRPVIWGSGSKGVSFLTTLGIGDEIGCVVDINPYRQGKFMPGSGHEIVPPDELRNHRPELVIVMNPAYVREIGADLERMGVRAEVVAV